MQHKYSTSFIKRWVLLLGVVLTGCGLLPAAETPPAFPIVPAKDLLVPASVFPPDWEASPCGPDCTRTENRRTAGRVFGLPTVAGNTVQEVYAYSTPDEARAKYTTYFKSWFAPPAGARRPLTPPDQYLTPRTIADESAFGCGVEIVPLCVALRRYDVHVVAFTFTMRETPQSQGLTLADIAPVLNAVEQRIAVSRKNPRPTTQP